MEHKLNIKRTADHGRACVCRSFLFCNLQLEAMKRQGQRNDLTSGQNDQKLPSVYSRDALAEQAGESAKQIQRYIRLTYLTGDIREERRRSKWENL